MSEAPDAQRVRIIAGYDMIIWSHAGAFYALPYMTDEAREEWREAKEEGSSFIETLAIIFTCYELPEGAENAVTYGLLLMDRATREEFIETWALLEEPECAQPAWLLSTVLTAFYPEDALEESITKYANRELHAL